LLIKPIKITITKLIGHLLKKRRKKNDIFFYMFSFIVNIIRNSLFYNLVL
jgi:hypothetical protein